ncbi:MAG: hypothetical protein J6R85_01545, partial [Lentisphaeria bacterium]|nr:hypothetical protein [Lentisphaeria bacterium]
MLKIVRICAAALLLTVIFCGCGDPGADARGIHLAAGGRVKTLDPALAEDLASRNMCAALYDTLLEYEYPSRPYRLRPAMLESMPRWSADRKVLYCCLRDDLYFPADPCFGGKSRKITSADVLYSIRRLADGQLHSPAYWMVRGKISGLDEFRRKSAEDPGYDVPVAGLEYIDERNFAIHLTAPDPRFLYILALPNLGIVAREAVEFYGEGFGEHPVGSGPFLLREWVRDYKLFLTANPEFRTQYFPQAQNPADRQKKLPLAESIVCYQVRQPFAAWLLFLQGELDASVLDKDNLDLVTGGTEIAPVLRERGVELLRAPEFEIVYTGFHCQDPKLRNPKLRKAIAMAFNTDARVAHLNHLLQKIDGPIPEGVEGFDETLRNPWQKQDPAAAAALLAEAGYPG